MEVSPGQVNINLDNEDQSIGPAYQAQSQLEGTFRGSIDNSRKYKRKIKCLMILLLIFFIAIIAVSIPLGIFVKKTKDLQHIIEEDEEFQRQLFDFFIKTQKGLNYTSIEEYEARFYIFIGNLFYLKAIYTLTGEDFDLEYLKNNISPFFDETEDEFNEKLGLNFGSPSSDSTLQNCSLNTGSLPSEINWVAKGKVNPVRDQKSCGSCYIFSTVSAIESAYMIKYNTNMSLSEQQILDCFGTCDGGNMAKLINTLMTAGVTERKNYYSYTANVLTCASSTKIYPVASQCRVRQSLQEMKAAVSKQPVIVGMNVDWSNYINPQALTIKDSLHCRNKRPNHAVVIVGYTSDGFWIVRNSWGVYNGMKGYFYVEMTDGEGLCGINTFSIMVSVI